MVCDGVCEMYMCDVYVRCICVMCDVGVVGVMCVA